MSVINSTIHTKHKQLFYVSACDESSWWTSDNGRYDVTVSNMSKWEWRQSSSFILKIFHSSGCNVLVWTDLGTAAWGSAGIGVSSSLSDLGSFLAEAPQAAHPRATLHPGERAGRSPSMGRWLGGLYLCLTTSGRQKKRIDLRILRSFQKKKTSWWSIEYHSKEA